MNLASFGGPALALRTHVTKRVEAMTPRQRKASLWRAVTNQANGAPAIC